jgi:hypothetical protein
MRDLPIRNVWHPSLSRRERIPVPVHGARQPLVDSLEDIGDVRVFVEVDQRRSLVRTERSTARRRAEGMSTLSNPSSMSNAAEHDLEEMA